MIFLSAVLQVAHPGLAGVAVDDRGERRFGDRHLALAEPVTGEGLGEQVAAGDLQLLFEDVAGEADHLHAVQKRCRDGVELVGGADKQDVTEVEGDVQVVVAEAGVLLRVEDLEQGRGRVALEGGADLVDLVEHQDRVGATGAFHRLEELAGHGPDVGAAVPLDLRLVAHAAQGETVEGAPEGGGDGVADAGLANPRGADQAEDRAGDVPLHLADGDELEDAVLDVLQPVVVAVEDLARLVQIVAVLAELSPGEDGQPVEVVAGDGVLGRVGLQQAQLLQLLVDRLLRLVVEFQLLQPSLVLLDLGGLPLLLQPQLLLDRLELFLEEELPLLLGDLFLDLLADLGLQPRNLQLLLEQHQHPVDALAHLEGGEDLLQLLAVGAGQVGGEIGQPPRVIHARTAEEHLDLLGVERVDLHQLLQGADDRHRIGLELGVDRELGGEAIVDPGAEVDGVPLHLLAGKPLQAVDQEVDALLLLVEEFEDLAGDPDPVEVVGGVLLLEVFDQDQADGLGGAFHGLLDGRHLQRAVGDHRDQQSGEGRPRAQRQNRQFVGEEVGGEDQPFPGRVLRGGVIAAVNLGVDDFLRLVGHGGWLPGRPLVSVREFAW